MRRKANIRGQPVPKLFLWIAASVADAAAVNRNGIKTILACVLSTFFIKDKPVFSTGPKSLPKNPPDGPALCNRVFDDCILDDEPLTKAFQTLKTCVLVNSNLHGKLFSSLESPTTFDESFKVTSVSFFIWDFNLLSCELDNFTFKVLIDSFYADIILK